MNEAKKMLEEAKLIPVHIDSVVALEEIVRDAATLVVDAERMLKVRFEEL